MTNKVRPTLSLGSKRGEESDKNEDDGGWLNIGPKAKNCLW